MEEGKLLEFRMQLENEKKRLNTWQEYEIEQISLNISFDMGRNKRISDNHYDSLFGHDVMVGCLSGRSIAGTVTTKIVDFFHS